MDLMREYTDKYFDLAIVDPPFPINTQGGGRIRSQMKKINWDNTIPSKKYFNELFRISKNQIIWGGNYFTKFLFPNNNWIVWYKNHAGVNFSECELAWSSIRKNIRLFERKAFLYAKKWHPCAKPVHLYSWLLKNYAKEGDKILDTHLGSMSIAVACWDLRYDLTGCEINKEYYDKGIEQLEQHKKQLQFF